MVPGHRLTWWLALPASLLLLGTVTTAMASPLQRSGTGSIVLEGSVIVISGNQLPGPRQAAPTPGLGCTVVALAGAVKPMQPGQALLPARSLKAPILARARCNPQGRFQLNVPAPAHWPSTPPDAARLTLMLEVPGGYYLNHFDGQGRYAAITLPLAAEPAPITLRDDRDALR